MSLMMAELFSIDYAKEKHQGITIQTAIFICALQILR